MVNSYSTLYRLSLFVATHTKNLPVTLFPATHTKFAILQVLSLPHIRKMGVSPSILLTAPNYNALLPCSTLFLSDPRLFPGSRNRYG